MVAYSFNRRFEDAIKTGLKTQTIRAARARHARVGEFVQLYCGMRTSACRRLLPDVVCTAVMRVVITFDAGTPALIGRIETDGVRVRHLDDFARRDGFRDLADMSAFWREAHPEAVRDGFRGVLIEWKAPTVAQMRGGVAA